MRAPASFQIVVEEHRVAAAPRPGLQRHGFQVAHVERRDDVEAFGLHPARVGRFLFVLELGGEVFGNDGIFLGCIGHLLFLTYSGALRRS
jgi:hypothetical protein